VDEPADGLAGRCKSKASKKKIMLLERMLQLVPAFVLVFFRLAGMMLAAPLFGSASIPNRVKLMLALVLAAGLLPSIPLPARMPETTFELAGGIGGEMVFGLAIGTSLSLVFVAVTWAGEVIGQQMGLGIGAIYDPQHGASGSVVGDLYFLLTVVIFLVVGGHHAFLRGVQMSFEKLPLLSVGMDRGLLDMVVGLLQAATAMAMQLAGPVLITMVLIDVVLGFLGKTVPQINVMSAGLSLRSLVGMVVLIAGLMLSSEVICQGVVDSVKEMGRVWQRPAMGGAV